MSPRPHSVRLRVAVIAFAAALLVPAASFAQHLQQPALFPNPEGGAFSPGGLYAGEFNGDGRPDFFTVSNVPSGPVFNPFASFNMQIRLLLSTAGGAFTQTMVTVVNQSGLYAAAGDVNGDGFQDIVI